MSAESLKLGLFSESTFPAPVSPRLLASSPTLNLAATVTNDDTLTIRRARGELVSSNSERGRIVQALRWKADGQFLAVAWDDGTVRLVGVENTKVVHRINVAQDSRPESRVCCIAWARNLTGKRHFGSEVSSKLRELGDEGLALGGGGNDGRVDLPHALTFLEIDTSLPNISPLPVSGGTGDDMFVFSTTASLESMFSPMRQEDNDVVDVMVVGTRNGSIHLSIYDSFPIGTFKVPVSQSQSSERGVFQLFLHASHPEVSTHSLLLRPSGEERPKTMYLVPMDLRFVSYSPVNMSLLASKTTTLQKLLRYIKQAQTHIVNEWQATRELQSRFLSFIQEDLQKMSSGPTDVVQALYHTVLTGHVHQPVREWLIDSIAERGHKRWEKTVTPGLESVRNLIHENMLPAIERSMLILSRLSGIARFHEQDDHIGFTNAEITRLVDIMAALNLICQRILLIVMDELDLFRMFSAWLRITIDRVSSSIVSEEIMEKEALLDPGKILRYIEGYLLSSPMAVYLSKSPKETWDEDWAHMQDSSKVLDDVDQQLRRQETGKPYLKSLPQMVFLVDFLIYKTGAVFKNIAEAEKRSVRFGQAARLEMPNDAESSETFALVDIKMRSTSKTNGVNGVTYTAVVSEENQHIVGIFETRIDIINGVSSAPTTVYRSTSLDHATKGRIIDIKFLDDEILLALCQPKDEQPHLVRILFRKLFDQEPASLTRLLGLPGSMASFAPARMEVMEANDSRGGVPARVCLLGKNGVSYKVFALPDRRDLLLKQ